jgi:hypothetical protein
LLKHNLAYPDSVRILLLTPRKVARMAAKPTEDPAAETTSPCGVGSKFEHALFKRNAAISPTDQPCELLIVDHVDFTPMPDSPWQIEVE